MPIVPRGTFSHYHSPTQSTSTRSSLKTRLSGGKRGSAQKMAHFSHVHCSTWNILLGLIYRIYGTNTIIVPQQSKLN